MPLQRVEAVLNPAALAADPNHPAALVLQSLLREALNQEVLVLQNLLEVQVPVVNLPEVQVLVLNHHLEVLNLEASVHQKLSPEAQALQEAVQIILLQEAIAQAVQSEVLYQYLFLFHGEQQDITVPLLEATTAALAI